MPGASILAIDLGKSRCRAVIADPVRRVVFEGLGAPGLAAADGVADAERAILPALAAAGSTVSGVCIGAAGAWNAPSAARELAARLAADQGAPVAIASDVVTAHAGALGGERGVLLIAGTGAAALGIDDDGARLIDGWGPELGDFGSGSWFGREALRAVLGGSVGIGAKTELTDAVSAVIGRSPGAQEVQEWIATADHLPRRLATLAPSVLDAAMAGDHVAADIVDDGIRLLTRSALAASSTGIVAMHGGLTENLWFRARLADSLTRAGRGVVDSVGDALDGARLLAQRTDLPHERFVHRAR